ncbi:hypothetical protein DBP19_27390 [Streptomyces sp. CS090A]|uniref:hypothetical protein n=1 Tax=Streptomyces TaxID=1883 RepID=UPI000D513579|nr:MULTISPECIES: hypothetical protein [Streptomyces]PVC85542.1 hypothetical protein DBP19_27390 [Streptomyces sp. CS090A]WRO13448.1 hypothetical protein SJX93_29300 [Streptomyces cyaneofuscatus]
MTPEPPARGDTVTHGDNSPAIGFVGKLFLSVFLGDFVDFTDQAKRWSGWNWPPFLLVVSLGAYALIYAPDGPARQFLWVHLALGTAVALALVRLVLPARSSRAHGRVLMSAAAVICSFAGVVGMDHLADHGEVDVTGRTRISGGTVTDSTVTNGSRLRLVVDSPADRSRLRLTLTVRDADKAAQFCAPETRYSAQLLGNTSTRVDDVRSGQTIGFPLGGLQGAIDVEITLLTDEGCRMNLFVTDAVLHD